MSRSSPHNSKDSTVATAGSAGAGASATAGAKIPKPNVVRRSLIIEWDEEGLMPFQKLPSTGAMVR